MRGNIMKLLKKELIDRLYHKTRRDCYVLVDENNWLTALHKIYLKVNSVSMEIKNPLTGISE